MNEHNTDTASTDESTSRETTHGGASTPGIPPPTRSRRATRLGETLTLRRAVGGRIGDGEECVVAVHVSQPAEVEGGLHHRVDVDRRLEDGTLGRRRCGVSVYDALSDGERQALVDQHPGGEVLWAERTG